MSCRPFFFFQAEDGIRDWSVTGVQTCALPIYSGHGGDGPQNCPAQVSVYDVYNLTQFCSTCSFTCIRSAERRVGKECRSRWWPNHLKKNQVHARYIMTRKTSTARRVD